MHWRDQDNNEKAQHGKLFYSWMFQKENTLFSDDKYWGLSLCANIGFRDWIFVKSSVGVNISSWMILIYAWVPWLYACSKLA